MAPGIFFANWCRASGITSSCPWPVDRRGHTGDFGGLVDPDEAARPGRVVGVDVNVGLHGGPRGQNPGMDYTRRMWAEMALAASIRAWAISGMRSGVIR
jgi:hypothetical protein